ncbi:MAG TPA: shikimate dehydrogenase [Beijerinckiaceae bacterium]|nr:shikimate dehydrogenase [Beijerinckiaceae bacterium]
MGISQSLEASTRAHGTGAGDEARSPAAVAAAGRSVLAGLIGSGIQASRSPSLHEREGAEQGLRYIYKIIDIAALGLSPDVLPELLTAARRFGFAGLNITHPCKQTVIPLLDALSPDARALGAVNTVVFENGQAIGHNTDWSGFAESFRRELADVARGRVVQFGAGGAGAAVAHALLTLGVDRLTIIDTDAARAEELAAALGDRFGAGRAVAGADVADAVGGADGIVNTTPLGMAKYPGMPLAASLLHPRLWVADIVYFPLETELLRAARARGCRTMSGGGMAVFQAVGAFRLFAGVEPDAERMLRHFASM